MQQHHSVKILVTGANGQLGTELHAVLEATMPGISTYTTKETLDVTDREATKRFIADGEYTHIINCAAYTSVDRAEVEPALCLKVNSEGVGNLASVAYENGIKIIHISTDYVFDGSSCRPYQEADKVNPTSTYGTSKRKGEMVLLSLCPDAIILRTSWLYSPHGRNFVKTMLRASVEHKNVNIICDQVGTPTSAKDLAAAISTIIQAKQWVPGIYHFSDEGVCSWYDFAKAIFRLAGVKSCTVTPISTDDYNTENTTAAIRPPYSVLDKQRIKKTYGLTIPHWEESLSECIETLRHSRY